MCTAISYKAKDFYFGRTLDYECSYGEEVVITPRHYQFSYSHMGECTTHYAMIGMAPGVLGTYSRGMGALGLPGDLSSTSRFVRAAFTKLNAISGETEESQVGQYFHIMETISQQKGCCEVRDGEYEYTIYTSCCNASQGIFYYTTYENRQITAVRMRPDMLERDQLIRYPMQHQEKIAYEN